MLLEDDRTATEEYIRLNLCALLQEVLGMLELEVIVVVVGLWTETNLLDYNLNLLCLDLLSLLLLLIEELLVVGNTAYWRICLGRDLDEVELHLISQLDSLLDGEHEVGLYVLTYDAHGWCCDLVVDTVGILLLRTTTALIALLIVTLLLIVLVIPLRLWAWAEWKLSFQIS